MSSLLTQPFKHYTAGKDRVSASDLNTRGEVLTKLARSLAANSVVDSTGILTRSRGKPSIAISIKLFAVQSEATGDGVYNCYEQTLDATEWDDTSGDSKVDDKNADSIEVLNLAEFDPEATYVAHLAADDLIVAWQKVDDEGAARWIGLPLRQANADRPRLAYCSAAAGGGSTIAATLDHTTGTAISVTCNISGGTALNSATRRLEDNDLIIVTKIGGTWYATEGFDTTEDCVCEAP